MNEISAHTPVLLTEIIAAIQLQEGQLIIDATFGAGGYARVFLEKGARVIAFDRDPNVKTVAKQFALKFSDKFQLIQAPFGEMAEELKARDIKHVDAVVFDLGVSSMQLDEAERGFSFMRDGPLDMRMSGEGKSAADFINSLPEKELADILYRYGEEKKSRGLARAIVKRREERKFTRTLELAGLIEKTVGRNPRSKIHPATRSFQALRIAVNDELGELKRGLDAVAALLKPGGKLAVVTFHSLEDRIVKRFMAAEKTGSRHQPARKLTKTEWRVPKLVSPSESEIRKNPRARSAKLRTALKM